jgi:hypothetical protein
MTRPRSSFHAARRASTRAHALRFALTTLALAAVAVGVWVLPITVAPPTPVAAAIALPPPPQFAALPGPAPAGTGIDRPAASSTPRRDAAAVPPHAGAEAPANPGMSVNAEPTASASPPSPPAPAVAEGAVPLASTGHRIGIDTRGYQAEVDRCLWVRMDIGAVAPIVGAHNVCGGDVVLALQPGDHVTLAGQDLDGDYLVTGSRNAHAGDGAAQATAGLTATVILQTCYWDTRDGVRLVTLVPAPTATPSSTPAEITP